MKLIVGVADMKISRGGEDTIVTHALGSCLGIAAYDPGTTIGGILHVMLPESAINPDKAKVNPYMFVDVGVPAFFRELYAHGAAKNRLVIKVAGGACIHMNSPSDSGAAAPAGQKTDGAGNDRFAVGKRNYLMMRKLFWKNGVLIKAEDVGGAVARTMYLNLSDGHVWLNTGGNERDL